MSPQLRFVLAWVAPFLIFALAIAAGCIVLAVHHDLETERRMKGEKTARRESLAVDPMHWYGGLACIALAILFAVRLPTPAIWAILIALAPVMALTVTVLPRSIGASVATFALGGQWSCVTVILLRGSWPDPIVLVVQAVSLWLLCTLIGMFHVADQKGTTVRALAKKVGRARELDAARSLITGLGTHLGASLQLVDFMRGHRGTRFLINCTEKGATWLASQHPRIASFLGVPVEFLVVRAHEDSEGQAWIEVNNIETLDEEDWEPSPNVDILDEMVFGRAADGGTVSFRFVDNHVFIGGIPGSGKTSLIHQVCATAIAATNALFVLVDATKGGSDFLLWKPFAWQWADDIESARRVLGNIVNYSKLRYGSRELDDEHNLGTWTASDAAPQIVLVIDEAATLHGDPVCDKHLQWIAQSARGAGVTMVCAVQRPHHEVFSRPALEMIDTRICLKVKTPTGANMIIDGLGRLGTRLKKHGFCYVQTDETDQPIYARTWHMREETMRAFAKTHRPVEPLTDAPDGDPNANLQPPAAMNPQVEDSVGVVVVEPERSSIDRMLELMADGEPWSKKDLAEALSLSSTTIDTLMSKAIADGLAEGNRWVKWTITDAGRARAGEEVPA